MAKDELKTIKFQMMLSESEARAIDDWGFSHRFRSRAEAIRRLCQMALFYDDRADGMQELAAGVKEKVSSKSNDSAHEIVELAIQMAGDVQMLDMVRKHFANGESPIGMDRVEEIREKLKEGRSRREEAIVKIKNGEMPE